MNEEKSEKEKEVSLPSPSSGQTTILMVDDDKFLQDMYALKFKGSGLAVEIAFSGLEALSKLRAGSEFDIILMDIIMPAMDGLEFLANIRKEKLAEKSTIIVLTNQADDIDKAKALGADGFIVKAMNIPSAVVTQVLDIYNNKKR